MEGTLGMSLIGKRGTISLTDTKEAIFRILSSGVEIITTKVIIALLTERCFNLEWSSHSVASAIKCSLARFHAPDTDQNVPQRWSGWKQEDASRRTEALKK